MIELKSPAEIERMHTTGRFVAQILSELGELADVGVDLLDLEHHVRTVIRQRGAHSCYGDYAPSFGNGPFPQRRLPLGQRRVGTPADDDLRLLRATEEALAVGIEAARPGNRLGD